MRSLGMGFRHQVVAEGQIQSACNYWSAARMTKHESDLSSYRLSCLQTQLQILRGTCI